MSGNKIGGQKARDKNYKLHGKDFYKRIGAIGGHNGRGPDYKGGFAANPELARIAGAKGGKKSRRTGVANGQGKKTNKDIDDIEKELERYGRN